MRPGVQCAIYLFCVLATGCSVDETLPDRGYPRVSTLEPTSIMTQSVALHAQVTFMGNYQILSYGFVWSTDDFPTINGPNPIIHQGPPPSPTFSDQLTAGLQSHTHYYLRAFITTSDYTVYGEVVDFSTR